jgi:hypothetical protein
LLPYGPCPCKCNMSRKFVDVSWLRNLHKFLLSECHCHRVLSSNNGSEFTNLNRRYEPTIFSSSLLSAIFWSWVPMSAKIRG